MKTIKNKKAFYSTKWITYTAVLTALVIATGYIHYIPVFPPAGANAYWCDGIIYIAAYLLDPFSAFIVGGAGSVLYDIIIGRAYMIIPSLLIHGLQGAVVSALLHFVIPSRFKKYEWVKALIFSLAGAVIVISGYFIHRYFILKLDWWHIGWKAVANVVQEVIGIAAAIIICYVSTFKKQLEKNRLLPDFKGEILQKTDPVNCAQHGNETENSEITEIADN